MYLVYTITKYSRSQYINISYEHNADDIILKCVNVLLFLFWYPVNFYTRVLNALHWTIFSTASTIDQWLIYTSFSSQSSNKAVVALLPIITDVQTAFIGNISL